MTSFGPLPARAKPGAAMRYDYPRLLALLRHIEAAGGDLEAPLADLSGILNVPAQSLVRVTRWAEAYGALRIIRTSKGFGTGRSPNRYQSLMTVDEWLEDGHDIVRAWKIERRAVKPPPKRVPLKERERRRQVAAEWERLEAEARAEVEAALASAEPLPPLDVEALGPLEHGDATTWSQLS